MAASAAIEHAWTGDLTRFSLMFWYDEGTEVAAIAASRDGGGVGWLNLRHVPPCVGRIALLWVTHAAARRPPWDVLYADELAALVAVLNDQEHAAEAE